MLAESVILPENVIHVPVVAPSAAILIAVSTVLQSIAVCVVSLRFLAKRTYRSIGVDDWVALLALVFSFGLYITGILLCTIGFAGFHASLLEYSQVEFFLKLVYADNIFYALTLPTIKFSILLMYHRVFPVKSFRYVNGIVGLIVLGWMIGVEFSQIFTCKPIAGAWNPHIAERCIRTTAFYYGNAIANLLTDVLILAIPLPMVWNLQMSMHQKLSLSGIFLLGGFVCISSVLRITTLSGINDLDITYTIVRTGTWTSTETPLALICACLPTLPSYFKSWARKMTISLGTKGTQNSNFGGNNASYLRPLKSSHAPSSQKYENIEGSRGATPMENISEGKKSGRFDRHMDPRQIHVKREIAVGTVDRQGHQIR